MFAFLMMPVTGSFWLYAAGILCVLVVLTAFREDARMVLQPVALRRFVLALALAAIGSVTLSAAVVYSPCNWEEILSTLCGGSEACAWAVWLANGCFMR